jgi:hypothetical protein
MFMYTLYHNLYAEDDIRHIGFNIDLAKNLCSEMKNEQLDYDVGVDDILRVLNMIPSGSNSTKNELESFLELYAQKYILPKINEEKEIKWSMWDDEINGVY